MLIFTLWLCFFDRNDMFTQWDRKKELEKLETSKAYYQAEIETTKKDLNDLEYDQTFFEKYARENFYLKRPHEEVFIVEDTLSGKSNPTIQ
ncbi:MAG: cell division protein DivIC (FtsB), stabilizes FtsL against RasP cleavage [Segetibacter sp.]|nr:cell division protein DivIC (FtsB), stabilizes FtsL against RasP cleavage [Segetibacter sp.]